MMSKKQRPFWGTRVNRKWTFCALKQWFWTHFWANHLLREKTLSNTNLEASWQLKREWGSLPVHVRRSKRPLLISFLLTPDRHSGPYPTFSKIQLVVYSQCCVHPRRTRGSQSGREKRRDERFQARPEEGGSSAREWKLSSRLFSRPDWLPLGLRGCGVQAWELDIHEDHSERNPCWYSVRRQQGLCSYCVMVVLKFVVLKTQKLRGRGGGYSVFQGQDDLMGAKIKTTKAPGILTKLKKSPDEK